MCEYHQGSDSSSRTRENAGATLTLAEDGSGEGTDETLLPFSASLNGP